MIRSPLALAAVLALGVVGRLAAQTEYYDTDAHRPLLTEDAHPVERHALELVLAPLSLERRDDGTYVWMLTPEIAYGILPRTHVELATTLAWRDPGSIGERGALAGAALSVLHQLQLERGSTPAVAIGGRIEAPVGGLANDDWYATAKAAVTRTLPMARVHLNGEYTIGPTSRVVGVEEASRWLVGAAADRALPLRSLLLGAEVTAARPLVSTRGHFHPGIPGTTSRDLAWRVGAGARWQRTPRLTMDVGLARTLTGPHPEWRFTLGVSRVFGVRRLVPVPAVPRPAPNDWPVLHDQHYLPAPHNWRFRDRYAAADRLFNAFDFGHAILYETLWTKPGAPASLLEREIFDRLVGEVLRRPPRLPLEEAAIEPEYARLVPEVKAMFDWAHMLHRQLYDVWADDRLTSGDKDARVAELVRYYRSRPDLAFSIAPKDMALMEGQPYSLAFRRAYPKFNGLIWAYHWLQVGLYDALMAANGAAERQANVDAAVGRFWQMLVEPPDRLPRLMPMTPAVAPRFTERYPEAAAIFDNLHSMHDVVSDILVSDAVPRERKRDAILEAARRYRDPAAFAMTREAWRSMSDRMGVHNMGGPAVGFTVALPTPTVPLGASHSDAMEHEHRR
jgi:hypothetical protein